MNKYDLIGQNYNETRKADAFIVSRILDLLDCEKSEEKPICAMKVVHQLTGIPLEEK